MEPELPRHEELVDERLVLWYFVAALSFMFASMLGGILMGIQLTRMNPFRGIELLSPGRWRMIHTNAIAYGFLANAFLGALHWAVPRLTLKPVFDRRLSYAIFFAWQAVVIATAIGILFGEAQGLEWGETPVWIDPIALAGLLLVAINFVAPIAKTRGPLYVSLWYFLAAFVWTFLTYAMGNFIPQYFVSGTGAGAVGGLFIHDLVGLFVTPLGWGLMYYFVPILLKKPIWSHGLSLVGFWGLAFFYPLTGIHHFLYTPIPMFLQYGAVISTIAVELVVLTVIINFFATIRGSMQELVSNLPIRWLYTGMVFYFLTCLQCAFQTTLTFQALIHFTDWVVGHAHMVMFGVFSMWLLGIMTYLIPRLLKTPWYSQRLLEWHYWLSTVGILVMSFDLIVLGLFQGLSWSSLQLWDVSIELSIPYWLVRLVAGLFMFLGLIVFAFNIFETSVSARVHGDSLSRAFDHRKKASLRVARFSLKQDPSPMLETKTGVFFIAGLGFFALAFLSNAVVPIMMYRHLPEKSVEQLLEKNGNLRYQFEDLAQRFPDGFTATYGRPPESAAQREEWLSTKCGEALRYGRKIYVGEGCWHCHSQFVRPVSNEERRWGPVSKTEEYQNELQRPVMFGTRPGGPDLSREGGRHSNDWHAVHFFQPTMLSEGSPMPEYPWFFDGSPDKPNARGFALMIYVQWLGSWLESYPYYEDFQPSTLSSPEAKQAGTNR